MMLLMFPPCHSEGPLVRSLPGVVSIDPACKAFVVAPPEAPWTADRCPKEFFDHSYVNYKGMALFSTPFFGAWAGICVRATRPFQPNLLGHPVGDPST